MTGQTSGHDASASRSDPDPSTYAILRGDEHGALLASCRAVIRRRLSSTSPTLAQIAREVGVSTRTLQRRLDAARTSYTMLLEEVRQELAPELLTRRTPSIKDISVQLGYADASSFSRAFRRWTGLSPRAYRRRVLSGQPQR